MAIINIRTGKPAILNLGKLMQMKLLAVYPAHTNKPDSKLLGHALVQLDFAMTLLMNIFKNQNGALFLKFPSQKVGDSFVPHVQFINLNLERDITSVLMEEISKKMGVHHAPSQPFSDFKPKPIQTDFVSSGTEDFPF